MKSLYSRCGRLHDAVLVGVVVHVLLIDLDGKLLLVRITDVVTEDLLVGHEGGIGVATGSSTASTTATSAARAWIRFAHSKSLFYVHNFNGCTTGRSGSS